ncbi:TonB-dependent receptor [Parapedobacter luteus]|nr:TonB-dependent receptor [Parapedobacter luteus]
MFKITLAILLAAITQAGAAVYAQKASITAKNVPLREVFTELRKQTGYHFLYLTDDLKDAKPVSLSFYEASLEEILQHCFANQPLTYNIRRNRVLVSRKEAPPGTLHDLLMQHTVTGKVTDERGQALEGVTVVIKNTQQATTTDAEGNYRINVPAEGVTLVFSIIGFSTEERAVSAGATLNVQLRELVSDLEEVVVVGYGTQKKVNLTGSVATVSGSELAKRPVGQTTAALQGAVPGLTIVQSSGQPGRDGGIVRLRGIGTLSDSNPLVMLDGVESSLANVDPNEIESITVLKDAASASIYGSRAANGVILITTKRGSREGLTVNYNSYVGWQRPTDMPKIVNAIDHMELINEAYTNTGRSPLFTEQFIEEYKTQGASNRDRYPDTDWQDVTMTENGFMQSHYLAMSGGTDRMRILGSFGYLDQGGVVPNVGFDRYNLRLNTDVKLNEKLNASADIFLRRTDLKEPSTGTGYIFHWMRRIPANQAAILSNGLWGEGWNGDNPIAKAVDGGLRNEETLSGFVNLNLRYKPAEWLTTEVMYAPKYNEPHSRVFANTVQTYRWDLTPSFATPARNNLNQQFTREWYNNLRLTATFDKLFAEAHQVTFLAGFQQEDQRNDWLSAYREVFLFPEYQQIDAGNRENERTGGSANHWALRSFFGRLNYNYKERYLFEANARYDGSSRFASNNKYALFPSVSAGWRIGQEPFMASLMHIVTDAKIRASWGTLGNQNIGGLYPFAAFINVGGPNYAFGDQISMGAALNDMANPDIKWETTEMTNIGLDLNLWSKFNLTYDWYYRKTTGILLQLDIPNMLGLTAPYQNAGVVENKGWDLALSYRDQWGQLNYGITVNLSDVKNKVIDMRGIQRTARQVSREGYPINSFFGYIADGFFMDEADIANHPAQFGNVAPGDIKYVDVNGDGVINTLDQQVIGSPIPRYTYSANIDLGYKGFDLSLFLQGVGKVDGFMFGQGIMPFFEGGTVQEQHKDRWTPDNVNAAFPRLAFNESNNEQNSTFWLRSAAYLRLKNIQLGYTLPTALLKGKLQRLRIYANAQNLFTLTDFWQGYDPEAPGFGNDSASNGGWYPQMKVFNVGLDVRF